MTKKNTSVAKTTNSTEAKSKSKFTVKDILHKVKTILQGKKARITSIICAALILVLTITCVLATNIPAWHYASIEKNYFETLQYGIDNSSPATVIVSNADAANLTDDKVRDLIFSEGIISAEAFDKELSTNEDFTRWSQYTHETIPLHELMEILTSPVVINTETDVISLTSYIINNIGEYDLTPEGLMVYMDRYTYNLVVIENLINAQTYLDKVYETSYETYSTIPDEDHVTQASPIELKTVYENFILSESLYSTVKNASTNIHRIIESYYYNILDDYQTSAFGSSDINILNTSYFSEGAVELHDLLYEYYLAAVDYEAYGTYHNLYINDETVTTKLQEASEKVYNSLGYCAVYYGLTTDPEDTFNFFEKAGSEIASVFISEKTKEDLIRKTNQRLCGYTTLGEELTAQTKKEFTGEFGFWNIMFESINTSPDALAPNGGIYISASNYINGTVVNMTLLPKTMMFNSAETSDTVKNLCWAKAIETFYTNTMAEAGITIDSTTGAATIPDDLTEEQSSAVNLIYAWANYATRFSTQ